MISLIIILTFFIVIASTWWMGLWSNLLTLVNFLLAAMLASSFFEPVASRLDDMMPSFTYLVDFLALWLIFILSFVVLRGLTELLSAYRLKFDFWTEMTGRSILSVWLACCFVCFACFSLHLAPLPPNSFQKNVEDRTLGIGPDRYWLAFVQSRSRGALSEVQDSGVLDPYGLDDHADDEGQNKRVFDPHANYIFTYHLRRELLSNEKGLRVKKDE